MSDEEEAPIEIGLQDPRNDGVTYGNWTTERRDARDQSGSKDDRIVPISGGDSRETSSIERVPAVLDSDCDATRHSRCNVLLHAINRFRYADSRCLSSQHVYCCQERMRRRCLKFKLSV